MTRSSARTPLAMALIASSMLMACEGAMRFEQRPAGDEPAPQSEADDGAPSQDMAEERDQGEAPGERDMSTPVDMGPPVKDPVALTGNALSPRQDELFQCDGSPGASPARLRRVGRYEWVRNTGRERRSDAAKNPFDPLPTHQYSTYPEDETLSPSVLEIYMSTVGEATPVWKTNKWSGPRTDTVIEAIDELKCFLDGDAPDGACVDTFARFLLEEGVLYRPATDDEVERLAAFARQALQREVDTGRAREATIRQVVSAAWMTSGALFRGELGQGEADEHGRRRLGDWELAHALAHALGGRAAGAMGGPGVGAEGHMPLIAQAAEDGTISDPAKIAALTRLYIAGADAERQDLRYNVQRETLFGDQEEWRGKRSEYWMAEGVKGFFQEWLGYLAYLESFKDTPEATTIYDYDWPTPVSGWDSERATKRKDLRSAYGNARSGYYGNEPILFEQMDDTIARIVAEDQEVFARLLTTRQYYVPSDTNTYGGPGWWLYNLEQPPPQTREGRWVTMPEGDRAGVLTHPAWLASHALAFENDPNPVHRGLWIREDLLCGEVPDVPITVEAALDPETRDQTTRARVQQKTEQPQCAGCHDLMNPLGYPFELYNHAGIMRVQDHGQEPNGSSVLVKMPDPTLNGPVRDAVEMSEKFAASPWVKRCFIRQTFRYYMGREERMADACALAAMEQAYDMSGGSFTEMLVALFTSDAFLYRTRAQE